MSRPSESGGRATAPGPRHTSPLVGPRAARLVILSGALLLVAHFVALFLVFSEPYTDLEWTLLLLSELGGLLLLAYGGAVTWRGLRILRESQREVRETRGRLSALIDASPLAIMAGNLDGRITLWNAAAERIFGWKASEVIGRAYPAVPEEQVAEWRMLRNRVLAGETVTDVEARRRGKDGRILDVNVSAAPVRGHDGEVEGTIVVIADVTQRREGERERDKLEAQLRQAQKMEAIGRLAGGIAHDFNNLLTAIKGHADLALADPSGDVVDDLQEIARSAERASALTRQLLAFTRQSIVQPRPLDLNGLIEGMDRLIQRLVGETITLQTDLDPQLGPVLADAGQLEQVVMNLVVNARDAMPDGGRIVIRTHNGAITAAQAERYPYAVRPGEYVVLAVTDTGSGMDEETARQVFDPFFTTKPLGVGTGLGLSTVYGIVKQAHGYIWVDTDPGMGTTFMIYMPRTATAPEEAEAEEPVEVEAGGTETVLVVEDEETVLSMARKTLERQGYHVLPALRGRDALRIAREHPGEIHVLFSDVVMPDLTGREVADRISRMRPRIRILRTSGYAEHVIARQGQVEEGIRFLPKPYTPRELVRRVRDTLEEAD